MLNSIFKQTPKIITKMKSFSITYKNYRNLSADMWFLSIMYFAALKYYNEITLPISKKDHTKLMHEGN